MTNTFSATHPERQGVLFSRVVGFHFAWTAGVVIMLLAAQFIAPAPNEFGSYALYFAPFSWALVGLTSLPIHIAAAAAIRTLAARTNASIRALAVVVTCSLWLLVGAAWLAVAGDAHLTVQLRTAAVFAIAVPAFGVLMPLARGRRI